MYMVAAILWLILIYSLQFWKSGVLGWLFLLVPLVVYGINLSNVTRHTHQLENEMFKGNFLSIGYLIVIFIINWEKVKDKQRLFLILMIVLILILGSVLDVWILNQIYVKHFRSILIVAAISLLAYVLYIYYEELIGEPTSLSKENTTKTETETETETEKETEIETELEVMVTKGSVVEKGAVVEKKKDTVEQQKAKSGARRLKPGEIEKKDVQGLKSESK
jgi:hypothetical protein